MSDYKGAERRQTRRPKPGSTMRRILDITFTQIRKTEEKKMSEWRPAFSAMAIRVKIRDIYQDRIKELKDARDADIAALLNCDMISPEHAARRALLKRSIDGTDEAIRSHEEMQNKLLEAYPI